MTEKNGCIEFREKKSTVVDDESADKVSPPVIMKMVI